MKANINDRASIEAVYPREAFTQDAARNGVGDASVLRGLRVMSQPDETGAFELRRAKRQTGERDPEGDTVFVPAFSKSDAAPPADADRQATDYAAYVDHLLAVARSVEFKPAIGRDERLAGFHGG